MLSTSLFEDERWPGADYNSSIQWKVSKRKVAIWMQWPKAFFWCHLVNMQTQKHVMKLTIFWLASSCTGTSRSKS